VSNPVQTVCRYLGVHQFYTFTAQVAWGAATGTVEGEGKLFPPHELTLRGDHMRVSSRSVLALGVIVAAGLSPGPYWLLSTGNASASEAPAVAAPAVPESIPVHNDGADVSALQARDGDAVPVMVVLDAGVTTLDGLNASEVRKVNATARSVEDEVERLGGVVTNPLGGTPAVPALLSPGDIAALSALPGVKSVLPSLRVPVAAMNPADPRLVSLGVPKYWGTAGGSNYSVAVLDTGVDTSHPAFAGKVAGRACFSSPDGYGHVGPAFQVSLCPPQGSPDSMVGEPCAFLDSWGELSQICKHGTLVAGNAVAAPTNSGSFSYSGVAPSANLVPVQVFSAFPLIPRSDGTMTVSSSDGDIIRALTWLYTNRSALRLAAVNLSLGAAPGGQTCGADLGGVEIRRLNDAGIPVVVAAGNDSNQNLVSWPACISGAVAVAASEPVDYNATGWGPLQVSSFSNGGSGVDIAAPGQYITSTSPGNQWGYWAGTSAAAPHVAGAAALWKTYFPNEPTSAFIGRVTSGVVLDSRNGRSYPRLNVSGLVPGAVPTTTTTPASPTTTRVPAFNTVPPTVSTTTTTIWSPPTTVPAPPTPTPPPTTIPTSPPWVLAGTPPLAAAEDISVSGNQIRFSGWAFDSDRTKPVILITVDGQWVWMPPVNVWRPDLWNFFRRSIDDHSGWSGAVEAAPGTHSVCAHVADAVTPNEFRAINCKNLVVK
jgi:subtilisin family serine protease